MLLRCTGEWVSILIEIGDAVVMLLFDEESVGPIDAVVVLEPILSLTVYIN